MEIQTQVQKFVKWIKESSNIVFFGGAGVSTESGIPDFRSVEGIYNQDYKYPPETILSHTFYLKKSEEFFKFYKKMMLFPDVVLYEEGLNENNMRNAINLISEVDVLIVGGTSLGVYPAAGLIEYYKGDKLVLINKSATPYDKRADLLINDSLGEVFEQVII